MSEWNLSVRLSGQGSDLSRTLRDTARGARTASRDVNALRRDIGRLRTEAARDIRVRLDVDADHLRTDIRAAITAAGGQSVTIGITVDDTGLTALRANARDTAHALNVLQRAAREAKNELGELEGRSLTTAAALRRINTAAGRAHNRLGDLSGSTRTFRTDLDDLDGSLTRVSGRLGDLRGRVGGLNNNSGGRGGRGGSGMLMGLLTFAPAAIPLAAGLTAELAPLTAQFTAAGVAGAAFGIAIAGQIGPLSDTADAEEKYRKAVMQHGAASKEAMAASLAYQQQLAQLPPASQQAAVALSTLKGTFSGWSNDMTRFTMKPVTNGIALLDALIPHLTPEVQSASTQLNRLVSVAGGAFASPGFDAFAGRVARFTDSKLDQLTDEVIHLMRVISSGEADHGVIAAFVDYAKANGPAAKEALKAIAQAVIVLMEGAAQAGPSLLTLVTAAAKLVAALPPELIGIILHVAAALKLLQLSGAGMAALVAGLARVRAQIVALSAASAGAGGGLAGLRAAFMSLGVAARASIIVAGLAAVVMIMEKLGKSSKAAPDVDRMTTSLGNLGRTGRATGEALRVFGKGLDGLAYAADRVAGKSSGMDKFNDVMNKIFSLGMAKSNSLKEAEKDIDALDKGLANLVKGGKPQLAAAALKELQAAYAKKGGDPKKLASEMDDYKSALADAALEQKLTADSMGLFGAAAQQTSAKLDAQKASADGLRQSIQALNDANRQGLGGMIGFEAAIDAAAKAAHDNAGALSMTNGVLNLGSEKARNAASALQDLADKTDSAAASARESGSSWETVNGIYERGRSALIRNAEAMGLSASQARQLADQILKIPDKNARVKMNVEDATRDLNAFNAKVRSSPGSKSVTLKTLSSSAEAVLKAFGFKVTHLPNGSVKITASAGGALSVISSVAGAIASLRDRHIVLTTEHRTIYTGKGGRGPNAATGGLLAALPKHKLADGGPVQYFPAGGYIQGPGSATSDSILGTFASGATAAVSNSEYVIQASAVRKYGLRILDQLNNGTLPMLTRLSSGGLPGLPHLAGGGFTYTPTGTMKSASDVQSAYSSGHQSITKDQYNKTLRARANAVDSLRAAEARLAQVRKHKHTHAQLVAAENAVAKARRSVATATDAAKSAEARYKKQFSLSDWGKTLSSAVKSNAAYEANLKKIAARGGGDIVDQLRDMGAEGATMVNALAKASGKQFASIVANLRKFAPLAKATLADYTAQLNASTKTSSAFQANLAKLAGMGYGDLATQLAAQGDDAAQKLAAEAVKSKGAAAKANKAAKNSANALTSEQLGELVQIIAAIKTKTTGIHDVAGTTGIGEDEIITVANKAKGQIHTALGTRAGRFLADLGKANKHLAYADGGIRAGLYATQGGIVRFAEPETHGEAYLPLSPSKRRHALPVLADVAHRFGVGLTDARSARPIVIVRDGDTTHVTVTPVRTGATASDIGAQVGRSVRRARRGGVAARAA